MMAEPAKASQFTLWDIPVCLLYASLGIFTRIWTDVTLYFDFGEDRGFQLFAVGVSVFLHFLIFTTVFSAAHAKWEYKTRNLLAMSALGGYLGFRMLTNLA